MRRGGTAAAAAAAAARHFTEAAHRSSVAPRCSPQRLGEASSWLHDQRRSSSSVSKPRGDNDSLPSWKSKLAIRAGKPLKDTLGRPQPALTAQSDLEAALDNALDRRAAFYRTDALRLAQLKSLVKKSNKDEAALGDERSALETALRRAMGHLQSVEEKMDRHTVQEIREQKPILDELRAQVDSQRERLRENKDRFTDSSKARSELLDEVLQLCLRAPNDTHPDVPRGDESAANIIGAGGNEKLLHGAFRTNFQSVRARASVASPIKLSSLAGTDVQEPDPARDHLAIAEQADCLNVLASQRVTGSSWPFLLGRVAQLEHALVAYAMDTAVRAGYLPVIVPDVVKPTVLNRTGFSPRDGAGGQTYWVRSDGFGRKVADESRDLALSGTAEIQLAGMCSGHTFDLQGGPLQLVATSHAFRAEAGARGQESRGLYRVHQFTKVELFVVCLPSVGAAESNALLDKLLAIQRQIIQGLGVPYRVLDMPTEELGNSAYRKYDIEAWMPGRGSFGEISSASNCTDYQSRRLLIKSNVPTGPRPEYAHTLNATAVAAPRLIIALLENYGMSKDGKKLRLPQTLQPYWLGDDSDGIEWIDVGVTRHDRSKDAEAQSGIWQAALDRVKSAAARSDTDIPSMVVAFTILHELTALIPLTLLFYIFCLLGAGEGIVQWLQGARSGTTAAGDIDTAAEETGKRSSVASGIQAYIDKDLARIERYGRRKGWIDAEDGVSDPDATDDSPRTVTKVAVAGTFANFVAAYAIVKVLLPVRIAASVALAGPFARVAINPVRALVMRIYRTRSGKAKRRK